MRAASFAAAGKANQGADHLDGISRPIGRHIPALVEKLRSLFPRKTATELASRTGNGVRAAERWLAGAREMSAEALIRLLLSDKGADLVKALADELPRSQRAIFWARLHRVTTAGVKAERMRRLRDELERLEQPDLLSPTARSDIRRR